MKKTNNELNFVSFSSEDSLIFSTQSTLLHCRAVPTSGEEQICCATSVIVGNSFDSAFKVFFIWISVRCFKKSPIPWNSLYSHIKVLDSSEKVLILFLKLSLIFESFSLLFLFLISYSREYSPLLSFFWIVECNCRGSVIRHCIYIVISTRDIAMIGPVRSPLGYRSVRQSLNPNSSWIRTTSLFRSPIPNYPGNYRRPHSVIGYQTNSYTQKTSHIVLWPWRAKKREV